MTKDGHKLGKCISVSSSAMNQELNWETHPQTELALQTPLKGNEIHLNGFCRNPQTQLSVRHPIAVFKI